MTRGSGLKDPLVWVDLEMTGLEPERHMIVEIAIIITDGTLEQLVEGPDLVLAADESVLRRMDRVVVEMHTASGLLDEIRRSTLGTADAEAHVLDFVRAHVPERSAPLAGNSIHADRAFLARYMPDLHGWLHYRNVDVSTIKELARRWYPDAYEAAPTKARGHRALADIRESIGELRHYRSAIFR
jgi:oligoribonuclease